MFFSKTSISGEFYPQPEVCTLGLGAYTQPQDEASRKKLPDKILKMLAPVYEESSEGMFGPSHQSSDIADPLDYWTLLSYRQAQGKPTIFTSPVGELSKASKFFSAIGGMQASPGRKDAIIVWIQTYGLPFPHPLRAPLCRKSRIFHIAHFIRTIEDAINTAYPKEPIMFLHHFEILALDFFLFFNLCRHWRNDSLSSPEAQALWEDFYGMQPKSPVKIIQEELQHRLKFYLRRCYCSPLKPNDAKQPWVVNPMVIARDPLSFVYVELMAYLSQDSNELTCPVCKGIFVPTRSNSICCSPLCSSTNRQRNLRELRRQAREQL